MADAAEEASPPVQADGASAEQAVSSERIADRLLRLAAEPPSPEAENEDDGDADDDTPRFSIGGLRLPTLDMRQGAARAGLVLDRVADAAARNAERLSKAVSKLEEAPIMRRTAAAAHGALATMASAAETAMDSASVAAAKLQQRRKARAAALDADALEAEAHTRPVPRVVAACVHNLAVTAVECEAVFAHAGSPEAVAKLVELFRRHPDALVPLRAAPTDVAAFLKQHLEQLPAPLLRHVTLARADVPEARRAADALAEASPAAAATAELVLCLAARIASVSAATKMDAAKLARALAPALTRRMGVLISPNTPEAAPAAAAAAAEEAAQDAAVLAVLKWMILNAANLRSSGGASATAAFAVDETELSE